MNVTIDAKTETGVIQALVASDMTEVPGERTLNQLPVDHRPQFAPVLHPTLETGIEAMVVSARAWLGA